MKWTEKGNELKKRADNIVAEFEKRKTIYIFGAGVLGEEIRIVLERYHIFSGYIDNNIEKQKNGWNGAEVIALQDYCAMTKKGWIVIAASEENTDKIWKQLEENGLFKEQDFFLYKSFMDDIFPLISYYCFHKLFVELTQICLTERCTLKCKKCAHGCFNVSNQEKDPSFALVKESADNFFAKFDIVKEFVLIGGEPFLYKDLKKVIAYIGENYRNQIITYAITTNGTILPDDEIIQLCMKYDVTLRVSDYSDSIPRLTAQYERFFNKTVHNKVIVWKTDKEKSWFDYGFGEFDRGSQEDTLMLAFDQCRTPCREIRGSKYYYCVMARSVAENLGMKIGEQDYIDLNEVEDREILLEFQMGYSEKGYLDMCRFCRGAEVKNYLIPAAEQVEKALGRTV